MNKCKSQTPLTYYLLAWGSTEQALQLKTRTALCFEVKSCTGFKMRIATSSDSSPQTQKKD